MSAPTVPFFSAQGASFGVDVSQVFQRVVDSGVYVLGPHVRDFERAFAHYIGVQHAVGVANGTDALVLALRALSVGPGQRVITVANAGGYASTAIELMGAQPLYVDVNATSLTLDPDRLSAELKQQSVACVIFTHLYGRMGAIAKISEVCAQAGIPLIEDCAQAHGAHQAGRRAGAWGMLACFSFYPTKNLGALGDGGAVLTNDESLAERVRALRQYGWSQKYQVDIAGGANSRLDELQAAMLLAKLPRLDNANAQRRAVAVRYDQAFADLPLHTATHRGDEDVVHLYVIRTPLRDALRAHLLSQGVASDVHYPIADHQQTIRSGKHVPGLNVTQEACSQVLSLPCYPDIQSDQVERVISAVHSFFDKEIAC